MLLQPSAKHIFIIITVITIHYYVLSACYVIGILYIILVPAMSFCILYTICLKPSNRDAYWGSDSSLFVSLLCHLGKQHSPSEPQCLISKTGTIGITIL